MRLTKLEDIETLKPFDCGDDDLNEFLAVDAMSYRKQMLANTFVLEDDEQTIAYYSLLNDKISNSSVPKNLWRKLRNTIPHEKHFSSYPAVKIGRLAVSLACKQGGIGTRLVAGIKQMLVAQQS